jgi:hypothetical protein
MDMKKDETTSSQTPRRVNWKHVSLVFLHFVVFVLSAMSESFTMKEASPGALPENSL